MNQTPLPSRRWVRILLMVLLAGGAVGCARSVKTYSAKGNVVYKGGDVKQLMARFVMDHWHHQPGWHVVRLG